MIKFSVIVPIYNVEKYVDNCIQSIVNQDYKDFECILVDDGSTDLSPKICDKYGKIDDRIVVIHKKNGGLSDARNAGMEIAKGDYYLFVDGDDYIDSDTLQILAEYLKYDSDIIVYDFNTIDSNGKLIWKSDYSGKNYKFSDEKDVFDYIAKKFWKSDIAWSACNKVYKSRIIKENNIKFIDNKKVFSEDGLFNMFYLQHTKKIISVGKPLYHYVQRSGSLMQDDEKIIKVKQFSLLGEELYRYIRKSGIGYAEKKYYIIFYKIMQRQYIKGDILSIIKETNTIENKSFFKKMTKKMLIHGIFENEYLSDTKKYFVLLHLSLLMSISNNVFVKELWKLFQKVLSKRIKDK